MLHQARLRHLLVLPVAAVLLAAAPDEPIRVESIDAGRYASLLASMKGRPLVVNMWATWCEPCREEFPDLVRLHADFNGRGIKLVVISMDMASDLRQKVVPFLRSQGAGFPAFIKSAGDDDGFINAVDPKWSGALPATFVYDPSGRLVRGITGPTNYEELSKILEPLAASPAGKD